MSSKSNKFIDLASSTLTVRISNSNTHIIRVYYYRMKYKIKYKTLRDLFEWKCYYYIHKIGYNIILL